MKLAIALLTYNRLDFLKRTLTSLSKSLDVGASLFIMDNGSTDGSADFVRELGGVVNETPNHSTGYGMNRVVNWALTCEPDIVLFTADDFEYHPLFAQRLIDWWEHAPDDVAMTSCYMEPCWAWNEVQSVADYGGMRGLIRASIPGSNWSFRAQDARMIFPVPEKTGGEDLETCRRLRESGYSLAALDLVKHIGEEHSVWGNRSWTYAEPLDYEKYGLERW